MKRECSFQIAGLTVTGWLFEPEFAAITQAPLILSCHGWQDNADSFWPLAQAMPGLRLLSIDWPGHGHSSHVAESGNYHFIDWVDILYQLLRQLNEPVVLLGHSMGALASSVFAASFPEHVTKLILIEGFGPITARPEHSIELVQKSLRSREKLRRSNSRTFSLKSAVAARVMAGSDLSQASAQLLCLRNLTMNEELEGALESYHWHTDPKIKAFSPLRMTEEQALAFMSAIECPVLSVAGQNGMEFVKEQLMTRAHLVANLQQVELAGGHHLHMENTVPVAAAIQAFLDY